MTSHLTEPCQSLFYHITSHSRVEIWTLHLCCIFLRHSGGASHCHLNREHFLTCSRRPDPSLLIRLHLVSECHLPRDFLPFLLTGIAFFHLQSSHLSKNALPTSHPLRLCPLTSPPSNFASSSASSENPPWPLYPPPPNIKSEPITHPHRHFGLLLHKPECRL